MNTIITKFASSSYPPGLRFIMGQSYWTPKTLVILDHCAQEHNACHSCEFKDVCRKQYDWLLDKYEQVYQTGEISNAAFFGK